MYPKVTNCDAAAHGALPPEFNSPRMRGPCSFGYIAEQTPAGTATLSYHELIFDCLLMQHDWSCVGDVNTGILLLVADVRIGLHTSVTAKARLSQCRRRSTG